MIQNTLLLTLLLPTLSVPLVYLTAKKSTKAAAVLIALMALADIALLITTVPTILGGAEHRYIESYRWIPVLNSSFTLFVDGLSLSLAIITLILILTAALFSIDYMKGRKGLAEY
jgi:multicomponent Na+:H+ antiporter subunit A